MKNSHFKNALLGIVLALAAAYLYIVLFVFVVERGRGSWVFFSLLPFVVIFYTSWVVIPLGIALGMLVPRIAYGKSRGLAALHGAALGATAGLITILCVASVYPAGLGETLIIFSVTGYSALWVGAYAFCRAKGQSIYR